MSSLLAKVRAASGRTSQNQHSWRRAQHARAANDNIHDYDEEQVVVVDGRLKNDNVLSSTTDEGYVEDPATASTATISCDKKSKSHSTRKTRTTTEDYQLHREEDGDTSSEDTSTQVHYQQKYAPFSSLFCLVQCIVLPLMMWQCGVAPMNINPMIGPYPDALNYWGAKNAVLIIDDGESWRLFTPVFLHAGIIHLLGNVMVQIDAGNMWEKEWGSFVWLIVYIGSAVGSSIFSCCFMPDNISVGSSGAVMGLFGAKFSEIFLLCCEQGKNRREKSDARSRKHQTCLVIGGIAIVMAMSFIPYVDWAAHVGGVLAGFVIGMMCFSFKFRSWFFKILWLIVGAGCTIAFFLALTVYMYNQVEVKDELRDVCGYYKQFFDDYDCNCMLDEAISFGSWQFGGGNEGNADGEE